MPYSASTFVGTDSHNALSHKGKGAWWHDERGKGSSVGAHAQYITPHAQHNTREREWEAPRDDLVACGHAHMPQWATDDPQAYWQAADRYSRTNACLAKEILVSLPKEFDHRQNLALLHDFLRQLPPVPTTWAFHEPLSRDGAHTQLHCHILLSPRQDDGQQRTPVQYFKQPNHGGVPTHRLWTPPEELRALRQTWEHTLQGLRLS